MVRGYGRLVNTKVNLDSKVIAIVGPNEAGKTTLLKALAHINCSDAVSSAQRSRAADVPDAADIVTAYYALDDADRAALAELHLDETPRTMSASRPAGGGTVRIGIQPVPRKARQPLRPALETLRAALGRGSLSEMINPNTTCAHLEGDAAQDCLQEMTDLVSSIGLVLDGDVSAPSEDELRQMTDALSGGPLKGDGGESLSDALTAVQEWCVRDDPAQEARNRLWNRTPDFLLFDEEDRSLSSVYTLDGPTSATPPAALSNLAMMAGLDLSTLYRQMQSGDIARRETMLTKANTVLEQIFAASWKQSSLTVKLIVDGQALRVVIWENGGNVTVFSERSAGLRTFVALTAFIRARGSQQPPILLIDEAENHLHIDAQADLVNMFMTQTYAQKVIYTTHSPGCLPPDLGSGIRSIVPRLDDLQISDISNSFWSSKAGYSPLMLAMGAAASAFTPARCVILAEGATEMILLPTLIRAATGAEALPYQVAPGLSEVPKDFYPRLELEGAKVAFLLDGDAGGDALEAALKKSGVTQRLIVRLEVAGVENLLEPSVYAEAVMALLAEANVGTPLSTLPALIDRRAASWAKQLEAWTISEGLRPPSKVAVANWLIQNTRAVPSVEAASELRSLHEKLIQAVGVNS